MASARAPIRRGPRIWTLSLIVRSQPIAMPWSGGATWSLVSAMGTAATKSAVAPIAKLQTPRTTGYASCDVPASSAA